MIFPDVPFAPGVPAIPRNAGQVPAVIQLLVADALSLFLGISDQDWGLFRDGAPVVTAESVVSFEFKKGSSISNFPVEGGIFESYNKVRQPFDVRLRFSTGGSPADREALLETADAAVESLDLMDAVTPEKTYVSVNPVHWDYRRTSDRGVGLIVVDIFCEQVRVTASSSFTSSGSGGEGGQAVRPSAAIVDPQSAAATPQVNGGTVQPVPTSPGALDLSGVF